MRMMNTVVMRIQTASAGIFLEYILEGRRPLSQKVPRLQQSSTLVFT